MAIHCPDCSSPVRRRRRRGVRRLYGLVFGVRSYRCQNPICNWQGWLRPTKAEMESPSQTTSLSDDIWKAFEDRVVSELNSGALVGSRRE